MSHIDVISEDVFEGESDEGYVMAISKALHANTITSDASHVAHIIIFGMHFENGKFKISIRIFITILAMDDKKTDIEPNTLRHKTMLEAYKIRRRYLKNQGGIEGHEDFNHFMHQFLPHDDVILSFNRGSIDNHVNDSLGNTWEINPNTSAYKDIYSAINDNLNLDGWAGVNLYTQPVNDISLVIPENTGFTRHFVDFAVTSKLYEMSIQMQNRFDEYLRQEVANNNINPNLNPTSHSNTSK